MLLSCCISSNNPDNRTPDLYLLLQHYLGNFFVTKAVGLVSVTLSETCTWWGCLKPLYSTVGRNPRDEGEMQHTGAGGRHNPSLPKTSQRTLASTVQLRYVQYGNLFSYSYVKDSLQLKE